MYPINNERLIKTFIELVSISSPSWKEQEVMNYIIKTLMPLGVSHQVYPCHASANLMIRIEGDPAKTPILFSAHMDTVVPCERVIPVIGDKKITSDGTTILGSDDKAAIAIFIEGLRCMIENNIQHGPIEILLSCAEELGLHGIKYFDMSQVRGKYAFVFDSGGRVGRVIFKAPYHSKFQVSVRGKAAHAGMEPEKGINAIRVLSEIITKLPNGRIDHETTMNVGVISGGTETNIVPDEANCRLEIRSIDNRKMKKFEKVAMDTIKKISLKHGAKYKVKYSLEYSGFTIKEDEIIAHIADTALNRIKIKPRHEISGGGSDTNVFNKAGIRAINLSCGMQNVHTKNEFIFIKDLIDGTKLMLSIIESARDI